MAGRLHHCPLALSSHKPSFLRDVQFTKTLLPEFGPTGKGKAMAATRSQRIAELNDLCHTAMGVAGRVVQTTGITALPPDDQSAIREKVEQYNDFTPENDFYGERDFGRFILHN